MYELTYFRSRRDNKTDKRLSFKSWDSFCSYLEKISKYPGKKPEAGAEITSDCSPLISPAIYEDGTLRRNENVERWASWAALDIDHYDGDYQSFDSNGFKAFIYSTPSSRENDVSFRLVVPLTRDVYSSEIMDFWYALNVHYTKIGDPAAKDASRMYYVPAKFPNSFAFTKRLDGKVIDPGELIATYPLPKIKKHRLIDRIPKRLQDAIAEEKKHRLFESGIDLNWTSYENCPFVNKKMIESYKIDEQHGFYHRFFNIMVSIASRAHKMGYEITPSEIETLMRELDRDTGDWYTKRDIRSEASRAIDFVKSQS